MVRRIHATVWERVSMAAVTLSPLGVFAAPLIAGANASAGEYVVALMPCVAPVAASTAWMMSLRRRTVSRLIANNYMLCTECRYAMDEVQETTPMVCPECGAAFNGRREIREAWRGWKWL